MKTKLFALLLAASLGVTGSVWVIQYAGFHTLAAPQTPASDGHHVDSPHVPAKPQASGGQPREMEPAPEESSHAHRVATHLSKAKTDDSAVVPTLAVAPPSIVTTAAPGPTIGDPSTQAGRRVAPAPLEPAPLSAPHASHQRTRPQPLSAGRANAHPPSYPAQQTTWEPVMAMQISQLGEALRQIDQHAREQQKSIDDVVDELKQMSRDRERNERALAQQAFQQQQNAVRSNSKSVTIAEEAPRTPRLQVDAEGDKRLKINVQDADIRDVLDLLSQQIEQNIVPLPSVQGKVTAFLTSVSIEEALEAILRTKGYVAEREGQFIYIGTEADFEKDQGEMQTRVYRPDYISAQELQQLITPLLTVGFGQATVGSGATTGAGAAPAGSAPGGALGALAGLGAISGGAGGGAAGAAGALRVSATSPTASGLVSGSSETGGLDYAGSDAVLVKDFEKVLRQIDLVVQQLDTRPRQVAIEAMILTVRLNDSLRLGVNFEALHENTDARITSGSPLGDLADLAPTPGALKFGYLNSSLSTFIDALENVGETNIVASPRLMCLNKQQAEILIGSELGFVNTTVTQTAATQSVEFLEVGTQLRFRPFITDDNVVRLELHPELSTGTVRIEEGLTLPDKEVTKVTTNILCRDGATVIIGGLIREDLTTSVSQLPVLGSVPYLGAAFRRKTQAVDRREIIVLITPRVVSEEDAHCEGTQLQHEFTARHETYRDKMSPLAKRQIGQRYLRQGRAAWNAGDAKNAFRYCNLALHYHPDHMDVLRLRQEILEAHPHLDLPLRDRYREGLRPWQRPTVNYPRKGVPWQAPAPIVAPHAYEEIEVELAEPIPVP